MPRFEIGGRPVGDGAPTLIVAELSANHGQHKDRALATIEAAARAGADAVKLQTYTPDTLTLKSDSEPFVVRTKNAWSGRTLHDLYAEAMTPWEWHAELKAAAEALGMLCFSTPFDATAVEFLETLDVPCHKVASFELTDLPLVERIAATNRPVIMSTGMATLGDIEAAVNVCRQAGNDRIVLLRCVSSYPARPEQMDLRSFAALGAFGTVVGLSDHTRDSTVAIASVALGARVIEKHLILDRNLGGPDSFFSLEPAELAALVAAVRETEKALGGVRFGPAPDERASVAFRRSLFVARDVPAGQLLTCDDVRSVRPSHGLPARHLPEVLGRPATRALRAATPLQWEMVGAAPSVEVSLRAATSADSERLLGWRNDPETRARSHATAEVGRAEHETWLAKVVASGDRLFIAERAGRAVGQVRLDPSDAAPATRIVSITVAPEARGEKLAAPMLRALETRARDAGVVRLVAEIKTGNEASVRAFKAAGYYGFAEARPGLWRCERRVAAY